MNPALATSPLAQAIGWALVHLVWQGALVAALLALTLTLLARRSAQLRYLVSCAALALSTLSNSTITTRSFMPRLPSPFGASGSMPRPLS